MFLYVFLLSFLFSEDIFLSIQDSSFTSASFFKNISKQRWEASDSLQKHNMVDEFINKQLCVYDAIASNFLSIPDVVIKNRNFKRQILINETYEQLVATPLIDSVDIKKTSLFAKEEVLVKHILIGYKESYLQKPPKRTEEEAFKLAIKIKKEFLEKKTFSLLAKKYSDDPSVQQNQGLVGWVKWGATVPEFQETAFNIDLNKISDPIKTAFGFHLLIVEDKKPSSLAFLSKDAYKNAVINLCKNSIRGNLREAAIKYDSLKLKKHNFILNKNAVQKIYNLYKFKEKELIAQGTGKSLDIVDFFETLPNKEVLAVFDENGYGPLWFSNRIKMLPKSYRPTFSSQDNLISHLKTIILQELAIYDGTNLNIKNSYNFKARYKDALSSSLYDYYLKYLNEQFNYPDSLEIKNYYNKHLKEKYMSSEKVYIKELRVSSQALADSLYSLLLSSASFEDLCFSFSSFNPENNCISLPFERKKNRSYFDAVSGLADGGFSTVIPAKNNEFSILLLLKKELPKPKDFFSVYSNIENLLIKENKDFFIKESMNDLYNKYDIYVNKKILK